VSSLSSVARPIPRVPEHAPLLLWKLPSELRSVMAPAVPRSYESTSPQDGDEP